MTVGSFFEIFKYNLDEECLHHFLYINIGGMNFAIHQENEKDPIIPNEIYDLEIVMTELVDDGKVDKYYRWDIPVGSKEHFLKYSKFKPDENPFVIFI